MTTPTYSRLRDMPIALRKAVKAAILALLNTEPRPTYQEISDQISERFSTPTERVTISFDLVRTLSRQGKNGASTQTINTPFAEEEQTIANLRGRVKYLEKHNQELLQERTLVQTVREALHEVGLALPAPPQVYYPTVGSKKHSSQEAVLQLSCWHYGEVVSSIETAGFGGYDIPLAQARAQYLVDTVIDLVHDHHSGEHVRKLWVVDLGDNISGNIHEELRVTNERPVISQVVGVSLLLSLCLRDLSAAFEEVELVGLPGNHPRLTQKPAHKQKAEDSFDRMVYEATSLLTAQLPNVKVTVPGAFFYRVEINGWPFLFMHGDNIRMWMRLPVYGLYRAEADLGRLYASKQEYFRYLGVGHFHQAGSLPTVKGKILMTGSLKGPDEYSLDALHTGAEPIQLFYGVHPRRGVSFQYDVGVSDADPAVQNRYAFDLPNVTLADAARALGLL